MAKLSDEALTQVIKHPRDTASCLAVPSMATELRELRAAMVRLHSWADSIEHSDLPWGGDHIANQVRLLTLVLKGDLK